MERNMLIAEKFLSKNTDDYWKYPIVLTRWWHLVSTAGLLVSKTTTSHIHPAYEKSIIIERTLQYIKDITT